MIVASRSTEYTGFHFLVKSFTQAPGVMFLLGVYRFMLTFRLLLKTDMGVVAFGLRVSIAAAEIKRSCFPPRHRSKIGFLAICVLFF